MRLDLWSWETSTNPVAWVGTLLGAHFTRRNLSVVERSSDRKVWRSASGLRLRGTHTWHVIGDGRGQPARVVVDAVTKPNAENFWDDFRAMEFSLGASLLLDLLVGVDNEGRVVGAMGPHLGFHRTGERFSLPPVPDEVSDEHLWIPALFQKIAATLAREDDRAYIAVAGYLDALVDHLDGAYLKAQVALEAYAKHVIGRDKPPSLVADLDAWHRWATGTKPEIEKLARDADAAKILLNKVKNAFQGSSTARVPAALMSLGMAVPAEALAEVAKRNISAHDFVMTHAKDRSIEDDVPRLRMVQSLLAGLVARAVGYGGPVYGWKQNRQGEREVVNWWPASDEPEATRHYQAEVVRDAGA
jgi:hypothetical protein